MKTDSFSYALERLDPASRALLDLSLRRGMRTEEIADVLGAEPESVEASRDEALQRIASDVGISELDEVRARLAELPANEWMGTRQNGHAVAEEPAATQPAGQEPAEEQPAEEKARRRVWPLLLGLVVIAGVIVAIALATSGDDNGNSSSSTSNAQAPAPSPSKPAPNAPNLVPLGASKASGTAQVEGNTLRLTASGLPVAHYQVWLYNSIIDARSIGSADGSHLNVTATLPGNWKRYRFVDVSREPRDGNAGHSGQSVLRVPTKSLR